MSHSSQLSVTGLDHVIASDYALGPQATYWAHVTLAVIDPAALWRAAVDKALQSPAMDVDALVDVLGPCEDPAIAECIAVLTAPPPVPGCIIPDYWVDHVPAPTWLADAVPGTMAPGTIATDTIARSDRATKTRDRVDPPELRL